MALFALLLLAGSITLDARPGGGQTYSGGSSDRGSSSSSRSDSDDDGAAALFLLIELCFRFPKFGVPLLLVVLLYLMFQGRQGGKDTWDSVHATLHPKDELPPRPVRPQLDAIRAVDPDFSSVLFEDFAFRLYATAHQYRASEEKLAELAPYLSASARRKLSDRPPRGQTVTAVVVGQMVPYRVVLPRHEEPTGDFGSFVTVAVRFEANYTVGAGPASRRFVVEEWVFRRATTARSKAPDGARRFACPNCGAPWRGADAARTQKCASCGEIVDNGRFDWQVADISLRRESAQLSGLEADPPERGTDRPTVRDSQVQDTWDALQRDDPQVTDDAIAGRLRFVYTTLNDAWSRGDLEAARPVLSDGLADYLQYWLDAYASQGLRNQLADMRLLRHELARVTRDRYFDGLTIRIWGSGKDYVVRTADGSHVRGDRDRDRDYSEYWTLIRSSNRRGAPRTDRTCASCGAPLNVTMAGTCAHCGSHVTAGEFDWVLSKIEQDEAY